jgi:hypothetical protein
VFYLTNILLHVIGKDKATLIDSGCLPADGLAELRPICITALERMKNEARAGVTEALYYEVIGLCAAAMYVFVPQGRIQGLRSMNMEMASSLFDGGSSFTSDFKTSDAYQLQPLLGTPEVKVYIYLSTYRSK